MQYIQTKTVYIDRDELIEIKAIEHDVKTRFIDFKFIAANKILDISHCIVRVYALNSKGNEIFNNLTIIDGAKGIAQLELTDSLLVPGTTEYKLKIYTDNGGILSSNRFNLIVSPDLMTGNAIEGSNEYTALDEALKTIGNINATEVRSKENASNIAKITEKLDYTSERMQDNTETIIYNLKNREGSYGDCIVIKADDGTFSMIDCFMEENYQVQIQQLDKIGVTKLKYFFATHDHSDHIGNAPAIIEKYRPDFIVFKDGIDYSRLPATEQEWDTKGYHDRMLAAADKFNVQKIVANDQQFKIGKNDYIEAFASKFYDYTNENSMSVNYLLVSHGTKSLFPGDSTVATETHLQNRIGKIDLYKLSHHGADGGNSDKRFEELQARYCLIDRLDVYKKDIIKNFALKCLKYGGKVYSNDNNDMTVFKITRGAIYPCCNEYKLPLQFLDYYSGRYKMTNEAGGIATKGIYPYKSDFYFVKDDGFIAKNEWIKHDGIDYHASSSGALDRNCFIQGTFNEKPCYYWIDENCKMVIEPKLIYYNNNTYLIKSNTLMAEEEFYEYQANYYYAGKGGALKKNEWLYKDSNYYWLKFNGIMASEETLFIEGKWYDFNGSGVCTNPEGRDTKNKE
ncbi:BppU family phage baseplate upper protein [Clostridium perfringens]|uniref:BppU family phage baseplate upper protein n=1 Tax=Clostridium perfringens TaxID=1502 RepID=UPI001105EA04|nr:BppU family phage baseplate upper protein [Clostridium perfringens]MDK0610312.1 BppU family phage baseplate upper protein [Clostridium perfringens]MDK0675330.1 BppU family phage baseplate upper protein [Clostridium perfringens]MDM0758043.1 BppU family phage baseplate upper protein [Clostridium perfringens]MDM0760993.1 BppU family phage baseplate upper protein [Clostridium perfringens]